MTTQRLSSEDVIGLQLQQSYESIRFVFGLAVQGVGILVAADSVLLGYGLAQRQAEFLLAAAIMPILIVLVGRVTITNAVPLAYVALRLERQSGDADTPTLGATYLRSKSPQLLHLLEEHLAAEHANEAPNLARDPLGHRWYRWHTMPNVILVVGSLAQVGIFVVALTVFRYPFM
ncbi:hypothetical protein [Micromonospora sp. NPDC005806]|uniref:hypothetical protein n=1 Tax=Micromonospora sp. NPDC005806 TaxID=3364234 RepID=UPI0036834481